MALNIKSDRAHNLAKELAKATGQNLTEAVTDALQHRLDAAGEASPRRMSRG